MIHDIFNEVGERVATVWHIHGETNESVKQRAHLYDAAPQLQAALQELVSCLSIKYRSLPAYLSDLDACMDQARAALDAAGGGQSS